MCGGIVWRRVSSEILLGMVAKALGGIKEAEDFRVSSFQRAIPALARRRSLESRPIGFIIGSDTSPKKTHNGRKFQVKPSRSVSTILTVSASLLALSGAAYVGTLTVQQWKAPSSAYAAPLSDQNSQVITGNTVPGVVARANPAVVQITDTAPAPSPTGSGSMSAEYLGSGFIISPKGFIITNDHVINQAKNIQVKLVGDPLPVPAKVVGKDYNLDLALLKVSAPHPLPTLSFASYRKIRIGQFAIAIGNPEALSHSVTFGIISAEDRAIQAGNSSGTQVRQYYNMLQTDAAINPGNSGGPLLNLAGQVVGVNTAVSTSGQGLGFAIPVSTVRRALPYLEQGKVVPEPYLGVEVTDVTEQQAKKLHESPVRERSWSR